MSALQSLIRRTASRAPTQTSALRSHLWNSASQPRRTFAASAVVAAEQDADPLQSAADGARGEALIRQKLQDKFNPSRLDVQDVSASSAFKGLSMVKQHQLVQQELKKEIEGIHGLQILLGPHIPGGQLPEDPPNSTKSSHRDELINYEKGIERIASKTSSVVALNLHHAIVIRI
ncbi:hypothetical protein FRC04_004052 [Tulasnella sp. 424]|nr:hypothetical protein FRC04_004052 [Tulasnella sp. 424]KAG8964595.1 hypothetical protein FRC05_003760 [Tulasnella sp. 425]